MGVVVGELKVLLRPRVGPGPLLSPSTSPERRRQNLNSDSILPTDIRKGKLGIIRQIKSD